jgi:hypothetical protein
MLSVVMLSVVMLNVVMLSVMAILLTCLIYTEGNSQPYPQILNEERIVCYTARCYDKQSDDKLPNAK